MKAASGSPIDIASKPPFSGDLRDKFDVSS